MATERCESRRRRSTKATNTTDELFHATTNPKSGGGERKQASPQPFWLAVSLRFQSCCWLLVSLDLLARRRLMMSTPEKPRTLGNEDSGGALEDDRVRR